MTGFVSGKSKVGEGLSRSSDTPHFSWFIEPYERWVYLLCSNAWLCSCFSIHIQRAIQPFLLKE